MNLDHANAQPHDLLHVTLGVGSMPRMHAAARNQPLGIFLHIVGDKCVDGRSESNQLRRDIIDEHRAIDADLVQMLEKLLRRAAELDHLIEVGALLLHGSQRRRFEHLNRLNVNVAIGDHRAAPNTARFAYTRMISRRYSGVSADVVNGLGARPANSPITDAACSFNGLPRSACRASGTSSGAGFTPVVAPRASSIKPCDFFFTAAATPASG